jgi:heptosyltransferase I
MNSREKKDRPHFCIVLLTGLGDVVNGLPLANAIRAAHPDARITWIVEPVPGAILKHQSSIDEIVVFHRHDGLQGLRKLWTDVRSSRPVDITLNLNIYAKSAWPTLFTRAPRRISFGKDRAFEGVWLAANEHVPAAPRGHNVDMFLEFARYLHIPVGEPRWEIEFSDDELRERKKYFESLSGKPIATVIPASATHKKDWIAERWAQVADALERDFGFEVLLAGGPGERETQIAREIAERSRASIRWAMTDSVRKLAWTVSGSDLVIAPDTGPVHIARAMNIPVIGLFGHTNPWRVGPWRAFQDLWVDNYTDPAAGPDPSNRKPKWDSMPTITVEQVIEKIVVAVDKYGVTRKGDRFDALRT